MKNIFKLMGIALIASSMFVACGGEEKPQEDNTPKCTITWNGESWDATASIFLRQNQMGPFQDYFAFFVFKTASDANAIKSGQAATNDYVSGTMPNTVSALTAEDQINYVDVDDIYSYGGDQYNPAGNYLRWNIISTTGNVTAYDATAMTVSANFSSEFFDLEVYEQNGGQIPTTGNRTMTGKMVNYHWDGWYGE